MTQANFDMVEKESCASWTQYESMDRRDNKLRVWVWNDGEIVIDVTDKDGIVQVALVLDECHLNVILTAYSRLIEEGRKVGVR